MTAQIIIKVVKYVCGWCDEESEIAYTWTESKGVDIVCSKCISLVFTEDPEAIKLVTIKRI